MRIYAMAVLLLALVPAMVRAADSASFPSAEEIQELTDKADEQISNFESAVNGVRPTLERAQPGLAQKYAEYAAMMHQLVSVIHRGSPTAYNLVLLSSGLGDLTLDAQTAALELALQHAQDGRMAFDDLWPLFASKNELLDINQLLIRATMRAIEVEENLLNDMISTEQKRSQGARL